jgi:hypothetical protein
MDWKLPARINWAAVRSILWVGRTWILEILGKTSLVNAALSPEAD